MTSEQAFMLKRAALALGFFVLGTFAVLAWMDGEGDVAGLDGMLAALCATGLFAPRS